MNRLEAWQAIMQLSKEEFEGKMQPQIKSADRRNLLFKFTKGELQVGYHCRPDLEAYALKSLMPDVYESLPHQAHPYSMGENWEYDPPKNGQNLIKHGLGFGEVVSYSGGLFGVWNVPCPDAHDGERRVVFSGLILPQKGAELALPPDRIENVNCTMSITQYRDGRYRFISSRLLSSNKEKYVKSIRQAINKFSPDPRTKAAIIDRGVEVIETYLMQ